MEWVVALTATEAVGSSPADGAEERAGPDADQQGQGGAEQRDGQGAAAAGRLHRTLGVAHVHDRDHAQVVVGRDGRVDHADHRQPQRTRCSRQVTALANSGQLAPEAGRDRDARSGRSSASPSPPPTPDCVRARPARSSIVSTGRSRLSR